MIPQIKEINRELEGLQKRQDSVMALSRSIVRLAGETITSMHAKSNSEARSRLVRLKKMVVSLRRIEKGFEYYSMQAHQEYVEACVLYMIIARGKVPGMLELGEGSVSYMLGVMDVVGELKRECFEEMRARNLAVAKHHFAVMQGIYDSTLHMRFANSVLPNFRKKQDVARIQLESTGSELLRLDAIVDRFK
ncbi:MAG: hypothetical protein KGH61_01475 [Candidatus Micrarchaeota archaeon]|nr:hypothetical protein [Candidatus Micrarchaeota archaeon]MDE1847601.1 hypothetical protein [Candidatus Micrarchaeota archaeon]MDE1863804.1 hypothetical protein [Candidatus Micrarchaeota archaeon]